MRYVHRLVMGSQRYEQATQLGTLESFELRAEVHQFSLGYLAENIFTTEDRDMTVAAPPSGSHAEAGKMLEQETEARRQEDDLRLNIRYLFAARHGGVCEPVNA